MTKVITTFSLDDQDDRDIITWLRNLGHGEKSRVIRDALRAKMGTQDKDGVTLTDVYRLVLDFQATLAQGVITLDTADEARPGEEDVDQDILDNLDGLGLDM